MDKLNSDAIQRRIIININHPDVDTETVFEFVDDFKTQLSIFSDIERIGSNSLEQNKINDIIQLYSTHWVNLYALNPKEKISNLFEQSSLNLRTEKIKTALLGPNAVIVKSQITKDPMLLILDWLDLTKFKTHQTQSSTNYSILFIESSAAGMDVDAQAQLLENIKTKFNELNKVFNNKFNIEVTGVPIFALKIKKEIHDDIQMVSLFSMLLILAIFIIFFRSISALILTASLIIFSISWAIVITQATFGFVHGITLAIGTTLSGICVDYYLHALVHASAAPVKRKHHYVKIIWPSMVLGGLTTSLGYFALGASGFSGLQQISVFAFSAIIIALLIVRYVIVDMMLIFNMKLSPRLSSEKLLSISQTKLLKILLFFLIVGCIVIGVPKTYMSKSIDGLAPNLQQLKQMDKKIRSRISGVEPGRFIIVKALNLESALIKNEQVYKILLSLRNHSELDEFYSVFPWLASKKLQLENVQSWNESLSQDKVEQWQNALERNGFSIDFFPPLVKQQIDYLNIEDIKPTHIWSLLSQQILQEKEQTSIVTLLGPHDVMALKNSLQDIPGAYYFSHKESIDQLAQAYQHRAFIMLLLGLIAIFGLLTWRFKSLFKALIVLSPALLAILFSVGIIGLLGKPMDILHLISLLLIAAICVDYGIFSYENRSNNLPLTFQSISASALTSIATFSILGISKIPVLQTLATTVTPGILIGFLLCPVIISRHIET